MHQNFYHWHSRAEMKPDPAILEKRWAAAASFGDKAKADDLKSLLRLTLFSAEDAEFNAKFSGALVKAEPTFPPDKNAELLRVMAVAALFELLTESSDEADCVALGVRSAAFIKDRFKPICNEFEERSVEYLQQEAEKIRPGPSFTRGYEAFRKASSVADWAAQPVAVEQLGKAVNELGESFKKIGEENQFSWWILGKGSNILGKRRSTLKPKEYALYAAEEASERVTLIPPPEGIIHLIAQAVDQCEAEVSAPINFSALLECHDADWLGKRIDSTTAGDLVPISTAIKAKQSGGKVETALLQQLGLAAKLKFLPSQFAEQYFRERMFLKSLGQLS